MASGRPRRIVDDADHDVVAGPGSPAIHDAVSASAELRALLARRRAACRPVEMCGYDVVARQADALRALPRTLAAEDHQPRARDQACTARPR